MFLQSYVSTAQAIVADYAGPQPFHLFIKQYFAAHKKIGARDRRYITALCYAHFRTAHALHKLPMEVQWLYGYFLCNGADALLEKWHGGLAQQAHLSPKEKLHYITGETDIALAPLFPFNDALSKAIAVENFNLSLLVQPRVYLRMRPGKESRVLQKLEAAGMGFSKSSGEAIAVANSIKLDAVLPLDEEAVIQDINSQNLMTVLPLHAYGVLKKLRVWDCCAASGGKSLWLWDHLKNLELLVSDVRPQILHNLRSRFTRAGISRYKAFVCDAAKEAPPVNEPFDLIICDAPCSGSGTWARTPEHLHTFAKEKIEDYAQLQQSIILNVSKHLKKGGLLLYSTCSVFAKENEAVVEKIERHGGLKNLSQQYFKGYESRADTLFAALFQKS